MRRHIPQRKPVATARDGKFRPVQAPVVASPQGNENVMIISGIIAVLVILIALGYILYPMISAAIKKENKPMDKPSIIDTILHENLKEKKQRDELRDRLALLAKKLS